MALVTCSSGRRKNRCWWWAKNCHSAPDQECFLGTGGNFTPSSAKGFNGTFGWTSARGGLDRSNPTWGQVTFVFHIVLDPVCIMEASLPAPLSSPHFSFALFSFFLMIDASAFPGSVLYLFTHWALMAWVDLSLGSRSLFPVMAWVLGVDADPLPKDGSLELDC